MFCDYALDLRGCITFSNALVNCFHVDCSLDMYVHVVQASTGGSCIRNISFLFVMTEVYIFQRLLYGCH